MGNNIKVSVIIPVYNDEEYIDRCLKSIVYQTLPEIEVICVNDASTDDSLSVLNKYADKDSRVKIINYKVNKSASQARKDAVLFSTGEYVMFVDADDWLELNACENLYNIINSKKVDIVHFETNIINNSGVQENRIKSLEKFLKVYAGELTGDKVFEECFIGDKYKFNLWNKIFNADLCKKAFREIKDGYYPKAQDMLAYFIISFYAKTYVGVKERYYNYNYGCGITGSSDISIDDFKRFCHQVYIADLIKEFLIEKDSYDKYGQVYNDIYKRMINECVFNWKKGLNESNKPKGYDLLVEFCGLEETVSNLEDMFYSEPGYVAKRILGAEKLKTDVKEVKTIATYYHRLGNGGVQRVIVQLIPIWLKLGYKVFVLTDEEPTEDDYKLPEGVERIIIPNCFKIGPGDYYDRAIAITNVIKDKNINLVIYHAFALNLLNWDICIYKGNNVPIILCTHNIFSFFLTNGTLGYYTQIPDVFKLCNAVTALSETDEAYYKIHGINAKYVPNPVSIDIFNDEMSNLNNKEILWVGRISKEKRPVDAIKIFQQVVLAVPEAKLKIVGKGNETIEREMNKLIKKYRLDDSITMCGYHKDVHPFYKSASVFLSTSEHEGFPITGIEFMSHGLPAVIYEMPYLEMYKNVNGCIQVEQGNVDVAARAIIKLLKNDNYRYECGKSCREQAENFAKYDYIGIWKYLIESTIDNNQISEKNIKNEDIKLVLDTMNEHLKKANTVFWRQREVEIKKVKSTPTFKMGKIILFLPSKIKKFVMRFRGK